MVGNLSCLFSLRRIIYYHLARLELTTATYFGKKILEILVELFVQFRVNQAKWDHLTILLYFSKTLFLVFIESSDLA
jgi:hypothetical protein